MSQDPTENEDRLRDYLRRMTAQARDALARVEELESRDHAPVAIVGVGCRFPGGVSGPDDLWRLLVDRRDVQTGFPENRGWAPGLFDADPDRVGRTSVSEGGFLTDAARFDPAFFGISPREADAMDPQQRVMLEVAWEALEHAGLDPNALRGSRTGVFAGVLSVDYEPDGTDDATLEGLRVTGSVGSVVSGRVAYALGLEGPALTVDTACSSSLTTLHLACRALRAGDCSLALAGGVTVYADPWPFVSFSRQRALAPDGRCKAYAQSADGMGLSEGAAVLAVELLSDAQRLGHRVLGVVRGSAVNQDGASNGLTAPSGRAQRDVIARALADARLNASDVELVEGHGTGTPLGDPIEARALQATYGTGRSDGPAWLGSVKSNLGHTGAAAGAAGVIKALMALRHGAMPASLHVEEPSRTIDWSSADVRLLREPRPWPRGTTPRRAAVSSFGVSGTNAHVVLEEAPTPATADGRPPAVGGVAPWILSARSPAALRAQAGRLAGVAGTAALREAAVASALATRRAGLEHRATVAGGPGLAERLVRLSTGVPAPGVTLGRTDDRAPEAVFVFPGQAAGGVRTARELLSTSPAFAAELDACAAALRPHVDWSLRSVVERGDEPTDVDVVQPVLFAVMVALARTWIACGVRPACVVGHSQGEIAAAVVAGALDLEDGARIVTARAHALRTLAGGGGMLALGVGRAEAERFVATGPADLALAADNGPHSTVVSGTPAALGDLVRLLDAEGVRHRRLAVDYAAHSAHVDPVVKELRAALAGVRPRDAPVRFCSSVTGGLLDPSALDAEYWCRNLREPVRFAEAVDGVLAAGHRRVVECSVHPTLTVAVEEVAEARGLAPGEVEIVPSLHRDREGGTSFLEGLGRVWATGGAVDWAFAHGTGSAWVDLPTYPFQHTRHWVASGPRRGRSTPELPDGLHVVDWVPVDVPRGAPAGRVLVVSSLGDPALGALLAGTDGGEPPDVVVVPLESDGRDDPVASAHDLTTRAAAVLRELLGSVRLDATRVVVVTRAVPDAGSGRTGEVAQSAVWGLLRSVQAEQPGRVVVVDAPQTTPAELAGLVDAGEPQLLVRDDRVLVPRLVPGGAGAPSGRLRTDGTVVVTGGTGTLGRLVALHLVREHGVRRLLLLSRRGPGTPGAGTVVEELEELGAHVDVRSCDVADREQLAAALATVPATAPLRGVVHTAGVRRDVTLGGLDAEGITAVLRPKVDASWWLHELTADADLDLFVLYSSVAGTLESPGQANYSAANAFVDAVARVRAARGLPAVSLAWGWWGDRSGLTADLDETDLRRFRRLGLRPMSSTEGLALLDAAVLGEEPVVVAATLDLDGSRAGGDVVPTILRSLAPATDGDGDPREAEVPALIGLLARTRVDARPTAAREFVRAEAATVLGHADVSAVDADRAFKDLGLDSLTAVELRNRVAAATGLRLPTTLVFDYPSAAAVGDHVLELLVDTVPDADEERVRAALRDLSLDRLREAGLLDALLALTEPSSLPDGSGDPAADDLDDLDLDILIARAMTGDGADAR